MRRRALVSQTRVPEIDRDRGSQRIDLFIRWLLADGWSVTFLASEEGANTRYARRLRQMGVATFAGLDEADDVISAGDFDLALLAFWRPASQLIPVLRERSPRTRVIVDSIDLHFLRDARRLLGGGAHLDERYGGQLVGELNAYRSADAVLTVSAKEAALLADFLGPERNYEVALAEPMTRSPVPFAERKGMFFVGNFRHLPNGEAVEYLCRDVLPRLDPQLLEEHPLSVVGSRLDDKVRAHARGVPAARMVGWVPSIEPYLERARVCVVPLLHGAGVKGKIVESLMAGTPVVTTPIGAEGLELRHGEHAVVTDAPGDLAAGLAHLLTDADYWQRLADAGHALASATHDPERVRERFLGVVDEVVELPPRHGVGGVGMRRVRRREAAYRETVGAVAETLAGVTDPGSSVLVISRGDDALLAIDARQGAHFPQAPDGQWAGFHPADSESAISHLEALRERGAAYLAVPSPSFWWLHHYRELGAHLRANYRRIHSDEELVVFHLGERAGAVAAAAAAEGVRVLVTGTYDDRRAGPPPSLVAELERTERHTVTQRWRPRSGEDGAFTDADAAEAWDWRLLVDEAAELPAGFLDDFIGLASQLSALGIERIQPAHTCWPDGGAPVTERLGGVLGREVAGVTPIPLLAVRSGAALDGPVALLDAAAITLAAPLSADDDPVEYSDVRDVFVAGPDGPERGVQRGQSSASPAVSVVIATHDRPDLLAGCLEGFCDQTLATAEFEVVVVDDGSTGDRTDAVLTAFANRLPLTWVRIDHAGRAAAKNLGILLARGEIVLFFDDDDVPSSDLLEKHLRAHEEHPNESTAILGHTDWAPGLAVSPLMHYLTEVDRMLFSYGNLEDGQTLDWRGFWEGRVSSKRSLHLRHGMHDQRLAYSIDVEMAWRLSAQGLSVLYCRDACSFMARPIDVDGFCARHEAKGRAQAAIAELHDDPEIRDYTGVDGAAERWRAARPRLDELRERVRELESELGEDAGSVSESDPRLAELHGAYREVFQAYNAKGISEELGHRTPPAPSPRTRRGSDNGRPRSVRASNGAPGGAPALTVTMPVWSRTIELAEMAAETLERVWEVARVPTEIVVVDNGSPVERPMRGRVHRFEENRGVATGWNTGIELAQAPVVAVLNSDCRVEPGWDEALYEAATTGRRIAFPYTDHCDGQGFRQPDQAGTAGWCFMLTREMFGEIGRFDERFNPAYGEDTDYWHRAWELGIELSPVPAAHVTHARRTSTNESDHSDWLLTGHRYLYGWKHGVDPMRAPPYYNREIVEYRGRHRSPSRAVTT